jgi:hypothetical protein
VLCLRLLKLTSTLKAAPPKMEKTRKPVIPTGTTYGGAGTFSEDIDEYEFAPKPINKEQNHAPIPSFMRPGAQQYVRSGHASRLSNSSGMAASKSYAQMGSLPPPSSEDVPPSLRPSSSMAQLNTYTPPYAPPEIQREKSPAIPEFHDQRRGSIPVSFEMLFR